MNLFILGGLLLLPVLCLSGQTVPPGAQNVKATTVRMPNGSAVTKRCITVITGLKPPQNPAPQQAPRAPVQQAPMIQGNRIIYYPRPRIIYYPRPNPNFYPFPVDQSRMARPADLGGNANNATASSGAGNLVWSPDKTRAVFTTLNNRTSEIWIAGYGSKKMLVCGSGPVWSPDGKFLLFQPPSINHLAVFNMDNGTVKSYALASAKRAAPATTDNQSAPTWSPDGTEILFARGGQFWAIKVGEEILAQK